MTSAPISQDKAFFRELVMGKVCSTKLPPKLTLTDITGALSDLCRLCFDDPGEEKVEWGDCIVLRNGQLHMPERHRARGWATGVAPECHPNSSDPEHREEYIGFAHTHPWVDGEPYPGFSALDFRASLCDGDWLSLVANGPELFALVRTSDCIPQPRVVRDEELAQWQRLYDELIAMEVRSRTEASIWNCLWIANKIMCERTGYALYYGDSWRAGGALDLLYRPNCREMVA